MSRDQRVADNWALLFARELAARLNSPLAVVFCLCPNFLGATIRQYGFMLDGLASVERALEERGISFYLLEGDPGKTLAEFAGHHRVGAMVSDFDPLRIKRRWKATLAKVLDVAFFEVDAHNIVPCWQVSDKQEYAAYTIRPKIHRALPEFRDGFPSLMKSRIKWDGGPATDWKGVRSRLACDMTVGEVDWLRPGENAARKALKEFVKERLADYGNQSNDPNSGAQSGLSPYLHFGQISAQRVAMEVMRDDAPGKSKDSFLEQLIVRSELSDNFCLHNRYYDSSRCFPEWARNTLDAHRSDPRQYIYSYRQLLSAQTHDELWNAAQLEMVRKGKMHGYVRMYWAKKILEWTRTPEEALRIAIRLNDRYELDGRDPNGYVGIAWSIGGVHDRPWKERAVFGKIRYMSLEGCRRKFDVDAYIRGVEEKPDD
jgi:deoxyribodipyrimidine photo-lyase